MKINGKALGLGFLIGLAFWAVAWALTVDQIWNNVYDATNKAIRLNQVKP